MKLFIMMDIYYHFIINHFHYYFVNCLYIDIC